MKVDNLNSSTAILGNVEVTNDVGNALPINGTITANAGTNLNTSLLATDAKFGTLGQKNMAGSAPVVISSDQAAIPVTANAGTNLNTSLLALENGGNLAGMNNKFPAVGSPVDAATNTISLTRIISYLKGYNGTTWDRLRTAVTTVSATLTGFLNTLPWAIYNATPTTRTEGQGGPFQSNSTGSVRVALADLLSGEDSTNLGLAIFRKPLAVSTYALSRDSAAALEASSIAKASAGNLFRSFGMIDKSAATGMYYILHLDSATLTGDGAVTHLISPIPINHVTGTDSSFDTGHFEYGVAAASGIVMVLSTTAVLKTIVTGGAIAMFGTTLYK